MNDAVVLGPWLRRFLTEYIVSERNLAINTRKSYRDTFILLLAFVSSSLHKPVDRLTIPDLTSTRILQFLTHLEDNRGCSVQTRNQRLTAVRSFARYVGRREPAVVEWCGTLCSIPLKKTRTRPIGWLTRAEIDALLAVPDPSIPQGRKEHSLLLFLYNTGARVSEAIQMRINDLEVGRQSGRHALATLHGKGGTIRQCPLWPRKRRDGCPRRRCVELSAMPELEARSICSGGGQAERDASPSMALRSKNASGSLPVFRPGLDNSRALV